MVTSQSTCEREVRLSFNFDRDDLYLEYSLIGVVVHLSDCPTVGEPGAPALPKCIVRVALPPATRPTAVQAEARDTVQIGDALLPIAPLQPPRPGSIRKSEYENTPSYRRPGEE